MNEMHFDDFLALKFNVSVIFYCILFYSFILCFHILDTYIYSSYSKSSYHNLEHSVSFVNKFRQVKFQMFFKLQFLLPDSCKCFFKSNTHNHFYIL